MTMVGLMFFDIFWLFLAYIFGSLPFGLLVGYIFGVGDIRRLGSGNIGVTNVLRCVGRFAAFLALLGDSGKGALVVGLYILFGGVGLEGWLVLFCVLGHNFSVWLLFRGGKGVATSFGGLLVIDGLGFVLILVWLVVFLLFRISSLAALVSFVSLPLVVFYFGWGFVFVPCFLLSLLVFFRHWENIGRLLRGEEKRINIL